MARISETVLERLKSKVSVARLVEGSGVQLKTSGKDLLGRCPFHEDDTASLAGQTADFLRTQTAWQSGQTIRLDACWLGNSNGGFAQQLSTMLNTNVVASPVRTITFGSFSLGPIYSWAISSNFAILRMPVGWKTFTPAKSP
jgi:hypothetical protein